MQVTSDLIKKYYPINIYPVITKIILNKIFNNIDIELKIYSLLFNDKITLTYNEIKLYEPIIIRLSNYILNSYNCAAFYYKQKELNNKQFKIIINIIVFLLNQIHSNNYLIFNENENENEIIIQYKLFDNFSIKYKKQLENICIYYKNFYN